MITVALLGDVMLGRGVNAEIPQHPAEWFWGDTLSILKSTDAVFANLECAITRHLQPWRIPKVFNFRADPAATNILRVANIRFVSLANNHSLDYEYEGLEETLDHLDAAGIIHAGAGRNLTEALTPALVNVAGLKIGVIAATDNEPAFAAGQNHPGTHYLSIVNDPATFERLARDVRDLRRAKARLVILSLHWGPNMVRTPPAHFQAFAHAALDVGIDLIHGHSAHIFQAVECRKGKLICYDSGDFLDDYAVDPRLRNDWSFIFLVDIDPSKGLQRLRLLPVRLYYAQVTLAGGEEFAAICQRMKSLCAEFDTPLIDSAEGLELSLSNRAAQIRSGILR